MIQKNSIVFIVGMACMMMPALHSDAEAGAIKWLKEAGETVFGAGAKKEARQQARERSAREAAEAASKQAARSAGVSYAGRATRAFEVGIYTVTGAVVFNSVLSAYGYASSESSGVDEDVVQDITIAAGNEEDTYLESYCSKPNGERYIVPNWHSTCGDGSTPRKGDGINLQDVRDLAQS